VAGQSLESLSHSFVFAALVGRNAPRITSFFHVGLEAVNEKQNRLIAHYVFDFLSLHLSKHNPRWTLLSFFFLHVSLQSDSYERALERLVDETKTHIRTNTHTRHTHTYTHTHTHTHTHTQM